MPKIDPVSFWTKIKATVGVVPFADQFVAIWYCAMDPRTPTKVKAILLGALAYFVLPFDIIPDVIVGLGYGDDLAVLVGAVRAVWPHITEEHRSRARDTIRSWKLSREA